MYPALHAPPKAKSESKASAMTDETKDPNSTPQLAVRQRTFLKGIVYFDNRNISIECTVRDLSDTGARIVFSTVVSVPDIIELYIPQRQMTLPATVRRRDQFEIGVSFEEQRSVEP